MSNNWRRDIQCSIIGTRLSEPQGVMMSTCILHLRMCVRAYMYVYTCRLVSRRQTLTALREGLATRDQDYVSARPGWERVKSVWLGTSAVCELIWVAENERRWTRTPRMAWHSAAGQRSSRRSVSSLRSFYHCMLAMNVKFALEQPSGMGVGHELA